MKAKFLRRGPSRYSKLGLRRKKKQVYRRPKGRDNKMREKRRGYPVIVSIGYGKEKSTRGEIQGKKPIIVNNIKDLDRVKKNNIIIVGSVGQKKRIEIVKAAKERKLSVYNVNVKKYLANVKKQQEKIKKLKEEKRKLEEKLKKKAKKKLAKDKEKKDEKKPQSKDDKVKSKEEGK